MTPTHAGRKRDGLRARWQPSRPPEPKRLLVATDHGFPVTVPVQNFGAIQRSGGWGPHAEPFLHFNDKALKALGVQPEVVSGPNGSRIRLHPGERAGAIPLRSGLTGSVAGGLVVKPRFGWAGVGKILEHTGWSGAPDFLELPLVPGSAREVPPWVLAGPALERLYALLQSLTPGYRQAEEMLLKPRGRILWQQYVRQSLTRGSWHHIPCRFPDLVTDPQLRRHIRWALESIHRSLLGAGGNDPLAHGLAAFAAHLIESLADIVPLKPQPRELDLRVTRGPVPSEPLRKGLEAISWIVDERGLGGGNERDGLAWVLLLERLWETYVEAVYRHEAAKVGGAVKVGRLRETIFPLNWSDALHSTLGHLIPDIVIRRGESVQVVDAKYKAHLAEVDDVGWRRLEEEMRNAHRADLHQVLAYASLYDAEEITATLVYPLRRSTFESLRERKMDHSFADLLHGGRRVRLELRGLPFGSTSLGVSAS